MTQNDRRNAKISEVCRVLANACSSENTTLYPQDIMTFINESRNSDIKELLALHMAINEADAIRRLEKAIECAEAWCDRDKDFNALKFVFDDLKRLDEDDDAFTYRSMNRMFRRHENEKYQRQQEENTLLDMQIDEYEQLLKVEQDSPFYSDNEIAANTYAEIQQAKFVRELEISRIASDAYRREVKHSTIIRFMREKLSNDEERALFLKRYAEVARSAGLNYHFL